VAALALFAAWGGMSASAADSAAAGSRATARAARSLDGTATAHLHLVRPEDAELFEEGPVIGALPGSMRAKFRTGAVLSGTFSIRTRGGSIAGNGRATTRGSGRYESFSGSFTVTGGTGRYSHAHGSAGLYGTFDRRTYALVIQTTGRFSY
jgi:hypothetical protein